MKDITIIGGGWSVRDVVLDSIPGEIIAVNDSAVLAPRWTHAVSMDRLWTEYRIKEIMDRCRDDAAKKVWLRRSALQNVSDWLMPNAIKPFECDHETSIFTDEVGHLNGSNSGMCALNLAWQLRPERIFLLGFDMNRDPVTGRAYWYAPYPWSSPEGSTSNGKYKRWALEFEEARYAFQAINCDVFNVSPRSAIHSFPKINPSQFMRMTR